MNIFFINQKTKFLLLIKKQIKQNERNEEEEANKLKRTKQVKERNRVG